MNLKFTKMHGAGNDFIVIDAINQSIELTAAQCRQLADRRFGIGADQILVVESPTHADTDFTYRIFNADGGEVEQCGNGARAFVRFVTEKKLTDKTTIRVSTLSGVIAPTMAHDGNITVDMGAPEFALANIPFDGSGLPHRSEADEVLWHLNIAVALIDGKSTGSGLVSGERVTKESVGPHTVGRKAPWISVVSMGNPHAIQIVDDVNLADLAREGAAIESHPRFAKRVNAGFMQIVDRSHIRLRVYERGAGETLACGTGACAAVVAGMRRGRLDSPVRVTTRGGELVIGWNGGRSSVFLSGPAVTVFEGEILI
jgi:diaminopimelate epimerase